MQGFGHYHEDYRKEDGQWRIARLKLTRLRVDNTGPWPQTDEALVEQQTAYKIV